MKSTHKVVFITNMASNHSYSKASVYGAIKPITSGNYPIFKTSRLIEEIVKELELSTEDDYLLISGSSVVASLCVAVWFIKHTKLNMLLFDRNDDRYILRVVTREELLLETVKQEAED